MSNIHTGVLGVVAHAKGDLRVEVIGEPRPEADEAVVEVAFGGICGSDLHYWLDGAAGESILREPLLLGHEIVGTVVTSAADGSGPVAGTRVAVHPLTPGPGDGSRYPIERPNLAPGGTYLGSAARFPHRSGAFARRVALPSRMLRKLPKGLSLRDAALVEPAAVAWHAVGRAGEVRGRRALVVGCGPIGSLVIAVLRHHGAAEIIAVDTVEPPLSRARLLGATQTLLATDADAIARVDADIVIESSGNYRGLESAVRGATRGGRIVMVGLLPSGEQPALISLAIVRELELVGSFRFNDEIDEVVAALADGSLDVGGIVTQVFPVGEAAAAFEIARDPAASGKVLLSFEERD
ncbi:MULTISPECIES: L-idonate 5-dehydrogenase [Cryobacterium]|uniref:L-idonate 5-dehydrogenase n=1 Tax=Cryobacterium glucosi TaxID=1259175 RepID=A0ABY2IUQ8_9MICO|nr:MULTISPECIES: L-idonate 5-dehydrogenase [Cryobacterium]TFB95765.1 L-idonate 5-dehydrogenase [Cryobacterium sp. MDB2-A-1]TFC04432.1 L-idonate 5-dehydrogenase [Cryobacterium sp. MDB2-33-2]TFC12078.1 L-idonate 5-dehydrogenase [Cryobacterium sp. MDB2-A-2]TFC15969.1 L-idonate 5-dehydrogenase [Cryobacterium sp. MDB2-10]TFC23349.1 L-idonate 5-dehydrogenase [Cryobacterium glucosi]